MICIPENEKVYKHYLQMLKFGHIPEWLVDHLTAYVKAYESYNKQEQIKLEEDGRTDMEIAFPESYSQAEFEDMPENRTPIHGDKDE